MCLGFQFILDDHIMRGQGHACRIICTQPRRISAVGAALLIPDTLSRSCHPDERTMLQALQSVSRRSVPSGSARPSGIVMAYIVMAERMGSTVGML